MPPGMLALELYSAIHTTRRDFNEATARGDRTRKLQARARLNDLRSTAEFIFGTYN